MAEPCPACIHGRLADDGVCESCGIAVARGSASPARWPFVSTILPDQDHVSGGTDYARTKLDKLSA